MDNSHPAIGADHPIFHVVSAGPREVSCGGLSDPRPVLWVNELQRALKSWDVSGLHAKDPAKLVRNQQAIAAETPTPTSQNALSAVLPLLVDILPSPVAG